MKKTLLIIFLIAVALGISSCKRADIVDPPWDGPAGFNILLEGSASPALLLIDGRIHTSTIHVRVTDSKGNPLANKTIFFEQLADSTSQTQVNWGYFQNNQRTIQAVTNANGEVSVIFYSPVKFFSDIMFIHALLQVDDRAYSSSVPQDYIAINMYKKTPAQGPVVIITSPPPNATVSGTVDITALAIAESGITEVHCYIDNRLLDIKAGSNTSDFYTFSWDSELYSNSSHTIRVTAFDINGVSASNSVSVGVSNTDAAPEVEIISPTTGATFTGFSPITITAYATDDNGIDRVSLYIDDVLQTPDMVGPTTFTKAWTPTAVGAHTIYVVAYDSIGQATRSTTVTVTIN